MTACAVLTAPPTAPALDWTGLRPVGPAASVTRLDRGVQIGCADGSVVTVSVLAPDLVRVRARFAGQPPLRDQSWAIARTDWPAVAWDLTEAPDRITVATPTLRVVVRRSPFLIEFHDAATGRVVNADQRPMARHPDTGVVAAAKRLGFAEHFYGLGEKAARLDKRRGRFTLWNTDAFKYVEGTDPLYQSIPFYLGLEDGHAYGLFYDNTHRATFEFGHLSQDAAEYSAEGGDLDYYYFHGPSLKQVVSRYTELTGRMPLPPLWALGHHQSRYSYHPESMVERVVDEYRRRDLPLDVVYFDIHYMDGYRVFTWDRTRFPDPVALTRRLAARGVHAVAIVDPGVKHQPADPAKPESAYNVYDEGLAAGHFLRRSDGSLWIGQVWPGASVFVDYTKAEARHWWGDLHRSLLDAGVAGIWNDMNEPSDFLEQTGAMHADVVFDDEGRRTPYAANRNVFALLMSRSTHEALRRLQPDRRPFVISRAGYAGIQRYAAKWTGDNHATFAAVALNIPMFTTLGLSGQTFVGADIPGYTGRADGELLVRAYQASLFAPFLRNHTSIDQYDNEPWRYGAPYEDAVRRALRLRYTLLPYLYAAVEEAHRTGLPVFRPLVLEFQQDENTANLDDQYMAGEALLVAPATRVGQRERDMYLPAGRWFSWDTGAEVAGGRLLSIPVPLDQLPVFQRGGTIVPSTEPMNHTAEKPWSPLRLTVAPDAAGVARGTVYEDDGQTPAHEAGAWRRTTAELAGHRLALRTEGPHRTPDRDFEIRLLGGFAAEAVVVDGRPLDAPGWRREADGSFTLRVRDTRANLLIDFR
jgi:alpha-glucosidase